MTKETKDRLREAVLSSMKALSEDAKATYAALPKQAWRLEDCSYDTGTRARSVLRYDVQRELGVTDAQVTRMLEALTKEGEVEEVYRYSSGKGRVWRWVSPDLRAYRKRMMEERNARNARAMARNAHGTELLADSSVGVWWAFGPQGHPASFRIHLDVEDDGTTYWHILSDYFPIGEDLMPGDVQRISLYVKYGEKVDQAFGTKWDWWKCSSCADRTMAMYPCPGCDLVRKRAKDFADAWYKENPPPESLDK